jgi:hypothetical protein
MPVTTRQQSKKQEMLTKSLEKKNNNTNHANIDFEDASKEWRKNKIKHENCCFTYIRIRTHNHK